MPCRHKERESHIMYRAHGVKKRRSYVPVNSRKMRLEEEGSANVSIRV